ncbi:hypothetical protein NGF19_17985 [Streptomyces sp. RY43-2]|uniref:Uncharacterized protein n=1 Tax=Streptomyces macrolidinus TaxID=2952607 RepID=A0ABT0ZGF4_9ACTN|nr:hypothetical protein [Streptomyces macrolidinus]MCN9242662.1 hypothetical protein [Streptomyces macrolidinus]
MALRPHALLPRQYDHRKVLATTVDAWGRALWLICPDAELTPRPRTRPSPTPRRYPYDALLVTAEGGAVREQTLHAVTMRVIHLDALPNGRFILHGYDPGREPDRRNAQIYGRDGRRRRSFVMGDAVEFMMADRRNHVWSAYFDEGVYADPISCAGLVRWDSGGRQEWRYAAPEGVEYIDTVYALNVDDGVAWAGYYPTFPLLEVRTNGPTRIRKSPVAAPSGMAVHGEDIVMLGGDRRHDRLHHCRLTEDEVLLVEEAQLTLPDGAPLKQYAPPVGRGRHLYVRGASSRQWFVLSA